MRENMGLYHGKRVDNGEWVYGFYAYIECDNRHVIITQDTYTEYGGLYYFTVDPDTVGECTGVPGKNGKLIFEGDIVRFHKGRNEPDWVGVIKWDTSMWIVVGSQPCMDSGFEVMVSAIDKATLEVIGNIRDNPELLDGGAYI